MMLAGIRFPNLGIELPDFAKGIFIGNFEIRYYGIIITLGFLAGLWVAMQEAKRTGQNPEIYLDYLLWMLIPSIIGARLYYVIFSWDYYSKDPIQIFNTRNGGLAIYGGVIAAILVLFIFTRIRKLSFLQMTDTAIMGLLIGQIMGRWGNFFNREAFGGYTNNLFAMQIPIAEAEYTTPDLLAKAVLVDGVSYIQVHPTFLYESMWNVGVLLLIFCYRKHKKFEGELLCLYMAGYGIGRFWIEGLRTDQLLLGDTGIAVSQLLAAILVVAGIAIIIWKHLIIRKNHQ